MLWARAEDEHTAMASITKTMTAIVALENGNPDDVSRFRPRRHRWGVERGSRRRAAGHLARPHRRLAHIPGNDASMAIAEGIAGGEAEFVR